jgi:ribosome-associated toxin RatA of RatAB toxin-antitoxin module
MTVIQKSALVAFTARQMFELVDEIGEYPRFLPWCRASEVTERTDAAVEAKLDIAWSGMHKSFTTRNQLYPHERMQMSLVSGPFRQFEGDWRFIALGERGCKVTLDLQFELTGHLLDRLFQPIFHKIADSLVDAFCKRAVEVYGNG